MRYNLYSPGSSLIHRLDPRTKLVFVVCVFVLVLVFNDPRYLAAITLCVCLVAALSGPAIRKLLGFTAVLLPVMVATVVLWPLFVHQGTPLVEWRFLTITDVGLLYALAMGQRIVVPCIASLLLFVTTRRRDVVTGLVQLGLPYQVGFGITIAFGFIPAMIGIAQTILQAQQARGLNPFSGGIAARLRNSASLIVPLLITALSSVQNLAFSMDSRGYGASRQRTYLHPLQFARLDYAVILGELASIPVCVGLRLLGHGSILAGAF